MYTTTAMTHQVASMRLLLILFALFASPALAQTTKSDMAVIKDQLTRVDLEIRAMGREELRILTDSVIDCGTVLDKGGNIRPECADHMGRYLVEYGDGRTITTVLTNMRSALILMKDMSDKDRAETYVKTLFARDEITSSIKAAFVSLRDRKK